MAHIVYIEDDAADYAVLARTLSDTRHTLHHFYDIKDFAGNAPAAFSLIISDLRLPGSYGFETVERVRGLFPDVPLLVVTGMGGAYMTGDLIVGLMERGAHNVISKEILSDFHVLEIIDDLLSMGK